MTLTRIDIFTDGGLVNIDGVPKSVSVGRVCINKKLVLTYNRPNRNTSTDFAEIHAIKKTLSRAYGYAARHNMYDNDYVVNMYCDSKSSVQSIKYRKTKSKTIERETRLIEIFEIINKFGNERVNIFHIRSHITDVNLKMAHRQFCKKNGTKVNFNDFLFIKQQNTKCDNLVKAHQTHIAKRRFEDTF